MQAPLNPVFQTLDQLFASCDQDYGLLKDQTVNTGWLKNYSNQRIVNSFLFNYIKIQDKFGASLFRKLLYALREINTENLPMLDILNILEKLEIIESVEIWDRLREIRNVIAHEYPMEMEERLENIVLALDGYAQLKRLYTRIRSYAESRSLA
jgi:hypothetical protein